MMSKFVVVIRETKHEINASRARYSFLALDGNYESVIVFENPNCVDPAVGQFLLKKIDGWYEVDEIDDD